MMQKLLRLCHVIIIMAVAIFPGFKYGQYINSINGNHNNEPYFATWLMGTAALVTTLIVIAALGLLIRRAYFYIVNGH